MLTRASLLVNGISSPPTAAEREMVEYIRVARYTVDSYIDRSREVSPRASSERLRQSSPHMLRMQLFETSFDLAVRRMTLLMSITFAVAVVAVLFGLPLLVLPKLQTVDEQIRFLKSAMLFVPTEVVSTNDHLQRQLLPSCVAICAS